MWVYHVAPFLCLKALFMMLFIRDMSKSCGIVALRTPKCAIKVIVPEKFEAFPYLML